VLLKVAGDEDGLEKIVSAVPGVSRVLKSQDGNLEFETDPGQDVRPAVARAVVEAKFDLLELRAVGMSLEDVFLELTREAPAPPDIDEGFEEDEMEDEQVEEEVGE
jgi:ABC-2 type transport system ATP-binding protein